MALASSTVGVTVFDAEKNTWPCSRAGLQDRYREIFRRARQISEYLRGILESIKVVGSINNLGLKEIGNLFSLVIRMLNPVRA